MTRIEQHRKIHTVAWEALCRPKDYGGLGLREAQTTNQALLMKAGWRLCSGPNALWISVVKSGVGIILYPMLLLIALAPIFGGVFV